MYTIIHSMLMRREARADVDCHVHTVDGWAWHPKKRDLGLETAGEWLSQDGPLRMVASKRKGKVLI